MITDLMWLFFGCLVLAGVLTVAYYFIRKWENNNPFCDRCQTRGADVETIKLAGQLTSFKVCGECFADTTIERREDAYWVLILQKLHTTAQTIEGYDIKTAIFWPRDVETKEPLSICEIVDKALGVASEKDFGVG